MSPTFLGVGEDKSQFLPGKQLEPLFPTDVKFRTPRLLGKVRAEILTFYCVSDPSMMRTGQKRGSVKRKFPGPHPRVTLWAGVGFRILQVGPVPGESGCLQFSHLALKNPGWCLKSHRPAG